MISTKAILTPVLTILITMSISAQINSGPGYMHGGNKSQPDTASKSVYDADKMKPASKADTTVIRRTATKASEARAEKMQNGKDNGQGNSAQMDTAAPAPADQSATSANRDTTASTVSTTSADCDCKSSNIAYGAIGLAIGGLIGLLIGGLMKRKKEDNQSNRTNV